MNAVCVANGEINTTHATHQGLTERLQHCNAALNVLSKIYKTDTDTPPATEADTESTEETSSEKQS